MLSTKNSSALWPLRSKSARFGIKLLFACTTILHAQSAQAQNACVAFYQTDGPVIRSAGETALFSQVPADVAELLRNQIEDGFNGPVWSAPFAQARYDDLIYTLDFLDAAFGNEFTLGLRLAVVAQFTSPIYLHETMDPLSDLFRNNPAQIEDLLLHHVSAFKHWQQFSLCAYNSPYTFYEIELDWAFRTRTTQVSPDVDRAYRTMRAQVPLRNLGGSNLIVRRSYLPDREAPRIRYALPPCGTANEPRNVEYEYNSTTQTWIEVEPFLEIGTWYTRGFEDPYPGEGGRDEISDVKEFTAVQGRLEQQFEELQAGLGNPIEFPDEFYAECDEE